jgi:large subunit ribosomal protein L23
MRESTEIIKYILRTEKGVDLQKNNQYTFVVAPFANKIEIKKAVEDIYRVKVAKVNTINMKGKKRRLRFFDRGKTSSWKKAVVTLKEGKIEQT